MTRLCFGCTINCGFLFFRDDEEIEDADVFVVSVVDGVDFVELKCVVDGLVELLGMFLELMGVRLLDVAGIRREIDDEAVVEAVDDDENSDEFCELF